MSYRLEFEIAGLPKLPNSLLGAHWRTRSGHAKRWERAVWAKCWPYRPDTPLIEANVVLTRFSSRVPDFDGLVLSFKPILDGLVACGVLKDDSMAIIGQPIYRHEKIGACKGKIKIEIQGVVN